MASPRNKVRKALVLSEEQFRRTIEEAPIPTIMQAEDGQVLQISRSWTELTGYILSDIPVFDKWLTRVVYDGADVVRNHMRDLFTGNKRSINVEFTLRTLYSGIRVWSFSASSPGTLLDGRRFIIGMAVDITEAKKAKEALFSSENKYRKLFETSLDGIVARDKNGHMIDCNQAYAKMVGYEKSELEALSAPELLPEKWHKHRKQVLKEVLEKDTSVVFEREYLRKDGSIFPASVRSWRLTDERQEVLGVWSIVRDITQQKALQMELTENNLQLEKLVEERTNQLKKSERLAAIGATAGMVGHDIRNPLQAIAGDTYLLKDYLSGMPKNSAKSDMAESIESIEQNISYINKIVADLQDYARPITPQHADVNLYDLIIKCFQPIVIPKDVILSIDMDPSIRLQTDPELFQRILTNLAINALQAMPKGGKLETKAFAGSDKVTIQVEDTGVGIPEHVKPKLFTPMMTTKAKGQGLGLAVVKRLVEAQKGTISFESEEGKGTKFIIELPTASD